MLDFGMKKIRTAVVGMGYWGPKFARNLLLHPDFELVSVVDLDEAKARKELDLLNAAGISLFTNVEKMLIQDNIDFVHVAVPPQFHFDIAEKCLRAGKHVLVEKPVGLDLEHRVKLVDLARSSNLLLFVDHTYLFTSEFEAICEIYQRNEIGSLVFYNSTRINLGLIQSATNVVEDLAVHDLAILDVLRPELPSYVICTGIVVPPSTMVSTSFASIIYADGFIAQLMVSWNSPVKVREIQIAGNAGMLIWDDMSGSDKVKIYNSKIEQDVTSEDLRISYHIGEGRIPSIISTEAIKRELSSIASSINGEVRDSINGENHILRVGRTLSALKQSLINNGERVWI
jgi:predicted dehydrogenase